MRSAAVLEREREPLEVPSRPVAEPQWLRFVALVGPLAVVAFGSVGLVLAVVGEYRPLLAFGGGGVVFAAAFALCRPALRHEGRSDRSANIVAAVGLACIVGLSGWNVSHHSEHVLINRDGGSYANTGRWLASHGSLEVDVSSDPFADDTDVRLRSHAVYRSSDDRLTFQFAHLLPVLLAEAHRVGGDSLMFAVPPILGGFALLGFFVLAWRLFRVPVLAVAATMALGLTIPQVSFSRDTYSEVPTQVLLFAGLWLLTEPRALASWRTALMAGVLLGSIQAMRVDALVLLLGLPLALGYAVLVVPRSDRSAFLRGGIACLAGVMPGLALGFWHATTRSPGYLSDLWPEVRQLLVVFIAAVVVAALAVVCFGRVTAKRSIRDLAARVGSPIVAVVTMAVGFGAWFVRPNVQEYTSAAHGWLGGLQQLDGVATPDPTRRFYERSIEWMAWYLGPVTVTVAIVALALLLAALMRGKWRVAVPALALMGPASVHYLWHAHASPDHIWVMRRFLTSALPMFVLLAVGMAAVLSRYIGVGRYRPGAALVVVAITGLAIAHPISTLAPISEMSEQDGFVAPIRDACELLGQGNAVVVLQTPGRIFHELVPQTIRSWCDLPVASMPAPQDADVLRRLASEWAARGRVLYVVADAPETITVLLPDTGAVVKTREVVSEHMLQETIVTRPHEYRVQELRIYLASVAPVL